MSDLSQSPPPAKRQRKGSEPPIATAEDLPVRSEIWMPYGDIILQAESTVFRVNRDILAKHSSVFEDLFSIPQPPNEETLESCPIVQLSDSAIDVQLLLTALYDPQSFNLVACMLRLGRKYEMTRFKTDAVSRIHHEFPTRLTAWDRRTATGLFEKIHPTTGVLVDLLNLAYENGIYTSIPTLAFRCLHVYSLVTPRLRSAEKLFEGVERGDGSRAIIPEGTKLTLALALERIQLFQKNNITWLKEDETIPSAGCKSRTKCIKEQTIMARIECLDRKVDLTYTIHAWNKAGGGKWSNRLCGACEEAAKSPYDAGRRKAWELLPTFFGLPGWKDLKDMDYSCGQFRGRPLMDLINYYAKHKHELKIPRPNGATSQKASQSDNSTTKNTSQQATIASPVHNEPPKHGSAVDSDIEEDDNREILPEELLETMQLLVKAPHRRPELLDFNKTQIVECTSCISRNIQCTTNLGNLRCDSCSSRKQLCSRGNVFSQWMIRHRFNVSWKKAEEVLKLGHSLYSSQKKLAKDIPVDEQANASNALSSVEVRSSPRTPVPRVRKAPTGITTAIDTPLLSRPRSRPQKRAAPSGPPRADRKRRKVLAPELELESKPEPEAESEPGREILPAPLFTHEPLLSPSHPQKRLVLLGPPRADRKRRETLEPEEPEPEPEPEFQAESEPGREILPAPLSDGKPSVHEKKQAPARDKKRTPRAGRTETRATLAARLAATEARLDAIEAQLQMPVEPRIEGAMRRHVVGELDRAIAELEGNVQDASERMRALHASLLEDEDDFVLRGGDWGPGEELQFDDEQDGQLHPVEQEDYVLPNLSGDETVFIGGSDAVPDDDTPTTLVEDDAALPDSTMATA
ncbi:hypothetical protein C8R44DRAFT_848895 [Mycena epipterygia]|nr:hypothetical protein C8R44DRAFT_848895 [Mycena epipterygia]